MANGTGNRVCTSCDTVVLCGYLLVAKLSYSYPFDTHMIFLPIQFDDSTYLFSQEF